MANLGKWVLGTIQGQMVLALMNAVILLALQKLVVLGLRRVNVLRLDIRRSGAWYRNYVRTADKTALTVEAAHESAVAVWTFVLSSVLMVFSLTLAMARGFAKGLKIVELEKILTSTAPEWFVLWLATASYLTLFISFRAVARLVRIQREVRSRHIAPESDFSRVGADTETA